jgi:hypothetical protein
MQKHGNIYAILVFAKSTKFTFSIKSTLFNAHRQKLERNLTK